MNDIELASRLEEALHGTPDGDHVDVATLLAGTRRRARRQRTLQRTGLAMGSLAAVASVAVVAVTVTAGPQPLVERQTAAGTPSTLAITVAPTRSASTAPRPGPSPTPESSRPLDGNAFDIPVTVSLTKNEVPPGIRALPDSGELPDMTPIDGKNCNDNGPGPTSIAGRWFSWANNRGTALIDLTVTGYAAGTGAARFKNLVDDTGRCRWLFPPKAVGTAGLRGDGVWAGMASSPQVGAIGHAAIRYGDVIIGVTVRDRQSTPRAAAALAKRLVQLAADRVHDQIPQAR